MRRTMADENDAAWRHPAQIYSALVAAGLFVILFRLRSRLTREGDLFKWYVLLYGATRFGLEFLRERNVMLGGLSLVQWTCLVLTAWSGAKLWRPTVVTHGKESHGDQVQAL